jgi:cobalt-zinc-cadmium efflux system outer membrane protein
LAYYLLRRASLWLLIAGCFGRSALAQQSYTWQQIKDKFETANPVLQAGRIGIDESKANEITAYLRPNPNLTGTIDQINPFTSQPSPSGSGGSVYRPFAFALPLGSINYLHERQHKRELRLESAKKGTAIAESQQTDLDRTLLFNLRSAFVQTLQAKAVLQNAKDNLEYWDHELDINQERLKAGDIAKVDQQRLALQRVQFETDYQGALVNLRTAKIQLLTLLNDRTPIDSFDVTGPFEFTEQIPGQDELRKLALDNRPDLKAAVQAVDKAVTDHKLAVANGSTDPTFGLDFARNPPIPAYFGFSVTIPLRINDRNQGEKARTELDIHKNEREKDAAEAQVFGDVDSAYATVMSTMNLVKSYKETYLGVATEVRDTVAFAYKRGGATLLDYLDAEKNYRDVRLAYLNLVGSFLTAGGQLNMAVGHEVIQ